MQIKIGTFHLAIKKKLKLERWNRKASEKITDVRSGLILLHTDQGGDLGASAENLQTSLQRTSVTKEENGKQNQSSKETEVEYE